MSLCQNRGNPRTARVRAVTLDTMVYRRKTLSGTSFSGVFLAAGLLYMFYTLYTEDFISQKVCFNFLPRKLDNLHPKF